MTRIGIIGLGFMGRMHYEAYQNVEGAEVVAVCDADPKRAAGDLSGGWGNLSGAQVDRLPMDRIKGTTNPAELLAMAEVEVVDVCLPTPAHVQAVTAALAAGKHVLCEKPLARTAAEARQIAEAAAKAKGFFMPAMCVRFWGEWEWLKRAADEKRYGKVLSASFRRLGAIPAGWFSNGQLSGGGIVDLHVHDTDFIYHLFGSPAAVFSRGHRGPSGEIDYVLTQYLYDDVSSVSAEGSWTMDKAWPFSMRYTVNFERASADYDSGRTPALIVYADGKVQDVDAPKHDGYTAELAYFLQCVRSGQRPQRVTAQDAVAGLCIVEAEKRSIESGRPEKVEQEEAIAR